MTRSEIASQMIRLTAIKVGAGEPLRASVEQLSKGLQVLHVPGLIEQVDDLAQVRHRAGVIDALHRLAFRLDQGEAE